MNHARGGAMFAQYKPDDRQRWVRSGSIVLHALLLAWALRRPEPVFVKPSQLAFGYGGSSHSITYLATDAFSRAEAPTSTAKLELPAVKPAPKPKPQSKPQPVQSAALENKPAA